MTATWRTTCRTKAISSRWRVLVILAIVAIASLVPTAADPVAAESAAPWTDWTVLRLNAHAGFLLSGRVTLTRIRNGDTQYFETQTSAHLLGAVLARNKTRTTIDVPSGRTKSYTDLSPKRGRHYAFEADSYRLDRLSPLHGYDAPLEQWEVTRRQDFPFPRAANEKELAVFDYYGMLLHLPKLELHEPGDHATLFMATSRGPEQVRIRVDDRVWRTRKYRDLATGRRVRLTTEELRLRVGPVPSERHGNPRGNPGEKDQARGFLGMKGETEIWVEAQSKTLLRIVGKVPRVPGRVTIKLDAFRR